jgi:hypothetical protein
MICMSHAANGGNSGRLWAAADSASFILVAGRLEEVRFHPGLPGLSRAAGHRPNIYGG